MARLRRSLPERLVVPNAGVPSPIRVRVPRSGDVPAEDFHLEFLRTIYEQHGFRMGALLAVLECDRRRLPVPSWLLKFLAQGIAKHIGPAGVSLDQSIGVVGREGHRRADAEFYRWNVQSHAVGLVHRMRSEIDPRTGTKYGVRGACRALAASGRAAGLTARSLEVIYRRRKREFD